MRQHRLHRDEIDERCLREVQEGFTTAHSPPSHSQCHIHHVTFTTSHSPRYIHHITFTTSHSPRHLTTPHSPRHIHHVIFTTSYSPRYIHHVIFITSYSSRHIHHVIFTTSPRHIRHVIFATSSSPRSYSPHHIHPTKGAEERQKTILGSDKAFGKSKLTQRRAGKKNKNAHAYEEFARFFLHQVVHQHVIVTASSSSPCHPPPRHHHHDVI